MGQAASTEEPLDDFIYFYSAGRLYSGRIKPGSDRPVDTLTSGVPQEGGPWAWSQEVQDAAGVVAGSAATKFFTVDRELEHTGRTWSTPGMDVDPESWSEVNREVPVNQGDPKSTYAINTGNVGGGLYALPLDIHKSKNVFDSIFRSIVLERKNNPQSGGRNKRKRKKSRSKSKMKRIRTMKYKKRTKTKSKTKKR